MSNEIVEYAPQTALQIREQVNLVQSVMQAVMKEETHYGVIPGTKKKTLFKPGAEVLAATFRIAVSYRVEDLSGKGYSRYRVTAVGTHQTSGIVLGEGMGACSSLEEKYKWRSSNSNKEFENTPEELRRIKYGYNRAERKEFEIKQVRTEAADLDNTILKMACKRAQVAMILNVVAASDCFTQDIEDLPEELRPLEEDRPEKPPIQMPTEAAKTSPANVNHATDEPRAGEGEIAYITKKLEKRDDRAKLLETAGVTDLAILTVSQFTALKAVLLGGK